MLNGNNCDGLTTTSMIVLKRITLLDDLSPLRSSKAINRLYEVEIDVDRLY